MDSLDIRETEIFDLFRKKWALVSAGTPEKCNGCTVGWGSFGTLWTRPGTSGSVVTVYLHPARYTCEVLQAHETFTVSFFPEKYRAALGYMGSHSGRDGDKAAAAGLTPVPIGDSVTYREAEMTFLCRKVYQHPFEKEGLAPEIGEYYRSHPKAYPPDGDGEWQPHWIFVGEILRTEGGLGCPEAEGRS